METHVRSNTAAEALRIAAYQRGWNDSYGLRPREHTTDPTYHQGYTEARNLRERVATVTSKVPS